MTGLHSTATVTCDFKSGRVTRSLNGGASLAKGCCLTQRSDQNSTPAPTPTLLSCGRASDAASIDVRRSPRYHRSQTPNVFSLVPCMFNTLLNCKAVMFPVTLFSSKIRWSGISLTLTGREAQETMPYVPVLSNKLSHASQRLSGADGCLFVLGLPPPRHPDTPFIVVLSTVAATRSEVLVPMPYRRNAGQSSDNACRNSVHDSASALFPVCAPP